MTNGARLCAAGAECAFRVRFAPYLLSGPEGPEPALGFSKKIWSPTSKCHEQAKQQNNKSFRPTSPGSRERFFDFYVIIIR